MSNKITNKPLCHPELVSGSRIANRVAAHSELNQRSMLPRDSASLCGMTTDVICYDLYPSTPYFY